MSSRYSTMGNGAHQRDLRTQLFSTPSPHHFNGLRQQNSRTPPSRTPLRNTHSASPYDNTTTQTRAGASAAVAAQNESFLNSLESQNDEEMDSMGQKIHMLKNLGERMGIEINKSIKLNDDITDGFERGKVSLKNTFNKMIVMSQRAGITWKMWLVVFALVGLFFFYVWLF
ncbi:conserved hypothetical protein [Lodderomyces elongisporus NRRL YB-4239]|uniref:t-SNARE coiled-coil homology domain-containing protein n=1 Tax=Lodderomyces elongisporus (strain ATCC 11503 / CBS 2605 / JCM 1781 / NBRC 1676 / NRRL YB-4239) TaxID=379508 RepID=A5DYR7_LODEL|nr:conserved hypothetical protein [Lodderomyces elongisporus NRRL YB-4239]